MGPTWAPHVNWPRHHPPLSLFPSFPTVDRFCIIKGPHVSSFVVRGQVEGSSVYFFLLMIGPSTSVFGHHGGLVFLRADDWLVGPDALWA